MSWHSATRSGISTNRHERWLKRHGHHLHLLIYSHAYTLLRYLWVPMSALMIWRIAMPLLLSSECSICSIVSTRS